MKKQKNQKKRTVVLAVAVLMAISMRCNTVAAERETLAARSFTIEASGKDKFIPDNAFAVVMSDESEYPFLYADNKSSTKIIVEVRDGSTGEICEKADGIKVKFSTTLGRMDADTVTMRNGKAVNIFYSQHLSGTPQEAFITAEIIASDKFPELNGHTGMMSLLLAPPDMAYAEGNFSNRRISQKITYKSSAIRKGKVTYGSIFSLNAKTSGAGKLTYKSSNSKILSVNAKGKVTVKGYGPAYITIRASKRGSYIATVLRFKLTAVPRRGKVLIAEQKNGAVRFQWKPEKTADGYEYAFAYNKKFSSQSRKKTSKTGLLLKNYKTGTKRMYFKVRTYKKVGKKTYYGSWSKVRALKLKKARKTGASSYVITN